MPDNSASSSDRCTSRTRVYRALTTAEGIRNRWTRDADLDTEVGGVGKFRFGSYGGGEITRVEV